MHLKQEDTGCPLLASRRLRKDGPMGNSKSFYYCRNVYFNQCLSSTA